MFFFLLCVLGKYKYIFKLGTSLIIHSNRYSLCITVCLCISFVHERANSSSLQSKASVIVYISCRHLNYAITLNDVKVLVSVVSFNEKGV